MRLMERENNSVGFTAPLDPFSFGAYSWVWLQLIKRGWTVDKNNSTSSLYVFQRVSTGFSGYYISQCLFRWFHRFVSTEFRWFSNWFPLVFSFNLLVSDKVCSIWSSFTDFHRASKREMELQWDLSSNTLLSESYRLILMVWLAFNGLECDFWS